MNFVNTQLLITSATALVSVYLGYKLKAKKTDIDHFEEQFKKLSERVDKLESENYNLMKEISDLKVENTKLMAENTYLRGEFDKINSRGGNPSV